MKSNMKTIAVTIDEETLRAVDELAAGGQQNRGRRPRTSRSAVVRTALRRYVETRGREEREGRERLIFSRHRETLARQAKALVSEQAGA